MNKPAQIKSYIIKTDEEGRYCYAEIPFAAIWHGKGTVSRICAEVMIQDGRNEQLLFTDKDRRKFAKRK